METAKIKISLLLQSTELRKQSTLAFEAVLAYHLREILHLLLELYTVESCGALMNEVATMSVGAEPLIYETKTRFCFIGCVFYSVAFQLMRSMGELAALSIGTRPHRHEIFAKGTLDFGHFGC